MVARSELDVCSWAGCRVCRRETGLGAGAHTLVEVLSVYSLSSTHISLEVVEMSVSLETDGSLSFPITEETIKTNLPYAVTVKLKAEVLSATKAIPPTKE